jgi:hypothetical protein
MVPKLVIWRILPLISSGRLEISAGGSMVSNWGSVVFNSIELDADTWMVWSAAPTVNLTSNVGVAPTSTSTWVA